MTNKSGAGILSWLTGDIEEGVSWRWRSKSVGRLTTIPPGVRALYAADDEAAVSVDTGPGHQTSDQVNVDAVTEPLVGDVVGMCLGLADQPHTRPFQRRRVLGRYHDVRVLCKVVDLTLWRPLLPYGCSYKASRAGPGYAVICNFWHPDTLTIRAEMIRAERQSDRMSKITNDGLTRTGTWCFIPATIWQQWASKGWTFAQPIFADNEFGPFSLTNCCELHTHHKFHNPVCN